MNDGQSNTTNPLNEPSAAISLGLLIPEQSPAPADSLLLDPKDTQKWIAALPMANIGETARQVYSTLVNFNRYEIPDLIRAKSIEQFRKPIDYVCANLQRHYLDTGFPLSSKGWKTSTLSRELNAELAISYKIIIEHMLAGDSRHFDRKLLVIALHRTLHYLGRVLLQTALAYSPWPKGVWKEINSVYAFASQNHVHQVPVKSTSRKKSEISTIEDNYKALLLFATAAPYRMRQQHISQLFQESHKWSHLALISSTKNEPASSPIGRFNIDLWSDAPPIHNALKLPTVNNRSIVVDLRTLLKKLREEFEQAPWDSQSNTSKSSSIMARPLLRQLILAWTRPPERGFVRTKLNFELSIVTGIHAIHGNLTGESSTQTFQNENSFLDELTPLSSEPNSSSTTSIASLGSGLSLSPINTDLNADSLINDSYLTTPSAEDSFTTDWQEKNTPTPSSTPSTPTTKVSTNNESAGGYCIQWTSKSTTKVRIGELIGVESTTQRQQYGLGVIRWLRHTNQHDVEVGLQMISNHIEAGQVYLANSSSDGNRRNFDIQRINCLLLPASDTDLEDNISSLVISNLCYPLNSNLWLNTNTEERLIRLTKLIEFSNSFAQFQFSYVNKNDAKLRNTSLNEEDNDFDDLWTNL